MVFLFFIALSLMPVNANSQSDNSQTAKNKKLLEKYYQEIMTKHNLVSLDLFITEDYLDHSPEKGQQPGRSGLSAELKNVFTSFPDLAVSVVRILAEGDFVAVTYNVTATTKDASGKIQNINAEGVDMYKMKNGKASEHWGYQKQ